MGIATTDPTPGELVVASRTRSPSGRRLLMGVVDAAQLAAGAMIAVSYVFSWQMVRQDFPLHGMSRGSISVVPANDLLGLGPALVVLGCAAAATAACAFVTDSPRARAVTTALLGVAALLAHAAHDVALAVVSRGYLLSFYWRTQDGIDVALVAGLAGAALGALALAWPAPRAVSGSGRRDSRSRMPGAWQATLVAVCASAVLVWTSQLTWTSPATSSQGFIGSDPQIGAMGKWVVVLASATLVCLAWYLARRSPVAPSLATGVAIATIVAVVCYSLMVNSQFGMDVVRLQWQFWLTVALAGVAGVGSTLVALQTRHGDAGSLGSDA